MRMRLRPQRQSRGAIAAATWRAAGSRRASRGKRADPLSYGGIVKQRGGIARIATAPVRMLIDRAGKIGLLGAGEGGVERQERQARRRLGHKFRRRIGGTRAVVHARQFAIAGSG